MPNSVRKATSLRVLAVMSIAALSTGCAFLQPGRMASYEHKTLGLLAAAEMEIRPTAGENALRGGTARVDITPPVGTPLAGFGRRKGKPSTGVLRPLLARVLVLSSGKAAVAWVSLDMMAVHEELFYAVLDELDPSLEMGADQLFLMASHTHGGSGALTKSWAYQKVSGDFNAAVFQSTVHKIAGAIETASKQMQPVRIGSNAGVFDDISHNRMKEGGPDDPEMQVVRVDNENGTALAVMVNMSAHPTILGSSNIMFSPNFPGYLAEEIERAFPESLCLFVNGAAADLKPRNESRATDLEESEEFGRRMGKHAVYLAKNTRTEAVQDLVSFAVTTQWPPVRIHEGRWFVPSWIGRWFFDRDALMGGVRVGNIIFLSVPGELSVEIGLRLKNDIREDGVTPIVMGYTNDYHAYILQEDDYRLPEYESRVSFYGPRLGTFIEHVLLEEARILKKVRP